MNEKAIEREKWSRDAEKNAAQLLKEANEVFFFSFKLDSLFSFSLPLIWTKILAEAKLAKEQNPETPKISLQNIDQNNEESFAALCSPRSARVFFLLN